MERLYEEIRTKYRLPLHLKKEQCDILQLLLQKKDTFVVWLRVLERVFCLRRFLCSLIRYVRSATNFSFRRRPMAAKQSDSDSLC